MFKRSALATMLIAATTPALAHTGQHAFSGFLAGFTHPLTASIIRLPWSASVSLRLCLADGRYGPFPQALWG